MNARATAWIEKTQQTFPGGSFKESFAIGIGEVMEQGAYAAGVTVMPGMQ